MLFGIFLCFYLTTSKRREESVSDSTKETENISRYAIEKGDLSKKRRSTKLSILNPLKSLTKSFSTKSKHPSSAAIESIDSRRIRSSKLSELERPSKRQDQTKGESKLRTSKAGKASATTSVDKQSDSKDATFSDYNALISKTSNYSKASKPTYSQVISKRKLKKSRK